MLKPKKCLTEATKHPYVFMLIYTGCGFVELFYPHFIWKDSLSDERFTHYTTSERRFNRWHYEGEVKTFSIEALRTRRKFIMIRIK